MRKPLLVLAIIVCTVFINASAQRTADVGFATGVVNYIGDLGNDKYFPVSAASPGCQVTVRNFLGKFSGRVQKPFSMELRLSWHRLQYDETEAIGNTKGIQLRNYLRGISFRNDLFGAAVNFTYTFYHNQFSLQQRSKFCYFLLAGAGVYHGIPKADLFRGDASLSNQYYFWKDGTIRDASEKTNPTANIIMKDGVYETDLQDWNTEGQGTNAELEQKKSYHVTNFGFPLGAGMRYAMNKKITFSMEFDYYYFLTDYLDDVSGRYATYKELKASFPDQEQFELAKYISDPTGRGTNGYIGTATSPRGNPDINDSYTFISFEVAYKLMLKKKSLWTGINTQ